MADLDEMSLRLANLEAALRRIPVAVSTATGLVGTVVNVPLASGTATQALKLVDISKKYPAAKWVTLHFRGTATGITGSCTVQYKQVPGGSLLTPIIILAVGVALVSVSNDNHVRVPLTNGGFYIGATVVGTGSWSVTLEGYEV